MCEPDISFETAYYYTATIATTGCYSCSTIFVIVHWVSALIEDFHTQITRNKVQLCANSCQYATTITSTKRCVHLIFLLKQAGPQRTLLTEPRGMWRGGGENPLENLGFIPTQFRWARFFCGFTKAMEEPFTSSTPPDPPRLKSPS